MNNTTITNAPERFSAHAVATMSTAAALTGQRRGDRNETASPDGAASSPFGERSVDAALEDVMVEPYGTPLDPSSVKGMSCSLPAVPAFGHVLCGSSPAMGSRGAPPAGLEKYRGSRGFGSVSGSPRLDVQRHCAEIRLSTAYGTVGTACSQLR